MAYLLALPFDVHISIVQHLSLKDCIACMQVSTVTHDAIQYVFSHRRELNFSSVLDNNNTIGLSPTTLMTVLYAHTRAKTILNFCLNLSFNLYLDFTRYFNLYWQRRWVDIDFYGTSQMTVGHPAGKLIFITYLGTHYGGSNHEQAIFLQKLWKGLHDWIIPMPQLFSHFNPQPNWSTVDIDKPYTHSRSFNFCTCPGCIQPTYIVIITQTYTWLHHSKVPSTTLTP